MMFLVSAVQTLSFVIAGNLILGIKGMTLTYWIILFSSSCLANLIGLNISSAFNSAATIYVLIPFIIIPQLLFSGVLVRFDSLHRKEGTSIEYVPILGDLMPARWAYEALATEQFKNNRFERNFFRYDMEISQNTWYATFLVNELKKDLRRCRIYNDSSGFGEIVANNFGKLTRYIRFLSEEAGFDPPPEALISSLNSKRFDSAVAGKTEQLLDSLAHRFNSIRKVNSAKKESVTLALAEKMGEDEFLVLQDDNTNKRLREIVLDEFTTQRIIPAREKYIQKFEPAYMKPVSGNGRAHFYAPYKKIGDSQIETFLFNILVLWFVSLILYLVLYFKVLNRIFNSGLSTRIFPKKQAETTAA
jgi:hypothetical protein